MSGTDVMLEIKPSEKAFWHSLDKLVAESSIVIDRPCGTVHPRLPDFIYPYDYGYLEGTTSNDGDGIDIWIGSSNKAPEKHVTAIIITVDLVKRDSEIKLLLNCTDEEQQVIYQTHDQSAWGGQQTALFIPKP